MVPDADTKLAAARFADDLARRLARFHQHMPSSSKSDLANQFLEAQVRSLLADRLAPKRLLPGTLTAPGTTASETPPPLVEDIVYDPQRGPLFFESGRFSIVDPATSVGVIQVKPSAANISKAQARLREIALTYFRGRHPGCVMGVIVADPSPEKKSAVSRNGRTFQAYDFTNPKWCPIFILFSRRDALYQAHLPAIEALLANTSRML
jgi:hypothetical protein